MKTKRKSYIHCSWDIIDPLNFIPRVPTGRIDGMEDGATPRICVADSVCGAMRAMPATGRMIKAMRMAGMAVVIHAYYLTANEAKVYRPSKVQVPDASLTGERWVLGRPERVIRRDYLVTDEYIHPTVDQNGNPYDCFVGCNLKRVKQQDNFENFLRALSDDPNVAVKKKSLEIIKSKTDFRTLMLSLDEELLEKLKIAAKEN